MKVHCEKMLFIYLLSKDNEWNKRKNFIYIIIDETPLTHGNYIGIANLLAGVLNKD